MTSLVRTLPVLLLASALHAQTAPPAGSLRYVLPQGTGAISVPLEGWQPQEMSLLDEGTRLVVQLAKQNSNLVASYLLFPNKTGTATSEACRASVFDTVLADVKGNGTVANEERSSHKTKAGMTLATGSYLLTKAGVQSLEQQNVFGFYGDAHTCFEIHLSKPGYKTAEKPSIDTVLESFSFDPAYRPTPAEYGLIASIFFTYLQDANAAAIYYQRAFDTLPKADVTSPTATLIGRMTVVQLAMSYGLMGDLARSRAVSEAAIVRDPAFPLPYYNLACADAAANDVAAVKLHLKQAFDRRANLPEGLKMPDPAKDDSFRPLMGDKAFTDFLQDLPKA